MITTLLTNYVQVEEFAPYETDRVDMHEYPTVNAVFDANHEDPDKLNILYAFVRNASKSFKGKIVVVKHGPEVRAFAKENHEKYQGS